jgi:putative FmdB family regulatory protein
MPIYEYKCEPCHHRFEAFLASATEQAVCPECNSTQLQRLMSTFAASVQGGYKSSQQSAAATAVPAGTTNVTPKSGGCGGGCACH